MFAKKKRMTPFQIIIIGFVSAILVGALLLMLPVSSKSGSFTKFNEALFTAVSSVCVTGLVVHDTASYWSVFGQSVILLLIQIGGLGVVTVTASFALLSGRKISLVQRNTMQEAISAPGLDGIGKLTGFAVAVTLVTELSGALIMLPSFLKNYGASGIFKAFFHAVSAFCNAGFDVMGTKEAPFQSLTALGTNTVISVVIMLLIVFGGIGFLTWEDIFVNKFRIKRYRMQTKVILITSLILIVLPAVYFFFSDFKNMGMKDRVLTSLFQAVTPRTAGFNTADLNKMTGPGKAMITGLMLVGGSPGSTAGGMKTTTIAVLLASALAVYKRKEETALFGRRINDETIKRAVAIFTMYIVLFFGSGVIISTIEKLPIGTCLFETASAVGTVGLTLGITPSLGVVSQIILMILMFFGRVGGLTLIYAAISGINKNISKLPQERITVG